MRYKSLIFSLLLVIACGSNRPLTNGTGVTPTDQPGNLGPVRPPLPPIIEENCKYKDKEYSPGSTEEMPGPGGKTIVKECRKDGTWAPLPQ